MDINNFYKKDAETANPQPQGAAQARIGKILTIIGLCMIISVFPIVIILLLTNSTLSLLITRIPMLGFGGVLIIAVGNIVFPPRRSIKKDIAPLDACIADVYQGFIAGPYNYKVFCAQNFASVKKHMSDLNFINSLLHCTAPEFHSDHFKEAVVNLNNSYSTYADDDQIPDDNNGKAFYLNLGYFMMADMSGNYLLKRDGTSQLEKLFDTEDVTAMILGFSDGVDADAEILRYKKLCENDSSYRNHQWELFYYLFINDALDKDLIASSQNFIKMLDSSSIEQNSDYPNTLTNKKALRAENGFAQNSAKPSTDRTATQEEVNPIQKFFSSESPERAAAAQTKATPAESFSLLPLEKVLSLDSTAMTTYVANVLAARGKGVSTENGIIQADGDIIGIAVSKYSAGADIVKAFIVQVKTAGAGQRVLITNGDFTFSARMAAEKADIKLIDKNTLFDYLQNNDDRELK